MEWDRDRRLMGTNHIFHRNLFSCSCPTNLLRHRFAIHVSVNTPLSWANLGKKKYFENFCTYRRRLGFLRADAGSISL